MAYEYSQRQLFGGSITCDIPTAWLDVSIVRQVPDHQEVYQGLSENPEIPGPCLIVEILEHQEVSNDEAAAYFFGDLAGANGVTSPEDMKFMTAPLPVSPTLPNNGTCCSGIGMQKVSHGRDVGCRYWGKSSVAKATLGHSRAVRDAFASCWYRLAHHTIAAKGRSQ